MYLIGASMSVCLIGHCVFRTGQSGHTVLFNAKVKHVYPVDPELPMCAHSKPEPFG